MRTAKGEAIDEITENVRDIESLSVTLPLGNPNLKLVHTNQFIWLELPSNLFKLTNMNVLSKYLISANTRYSVYEENKYYIEEVTITNDGTTATMELGLNPFASPLSEYKDNRENYLNAYKNAYEQSKEQSKDDSTEKTPSVNNNKNTTLRGGESKIINEAVKKIVGTATNDLKKAKLIHQWLIKHCAYNYYENSKYSSAVAVYKVVTNGKKVNCADTSRLTRAMMYSAGLTTNVRHIPGHYFTEMKCNGKWYCSDATSKQRKFNYYFACKGCANRKYTSRVGKNNGKNPET